jgi:hypothetical protein
VATLIIGETRTISKLLRIYLNYILGKPDIKEIQKTATSGTAQILRKILT